MFLDSQDNEEVFADLNKSIWETKNLISATAASALIIHNGVIVNEWYSGFHENNENSRLVDAESQFNIASIRKTYLGFAISLALHEGRIKSLDDTVSDSY